MTIVPNLTHSSIVNVVAGVIRDHAGRILLGRRPSHVDQGNLWEFPGGKQEAQESPFQALQRELFEEVNVQVQQARPLIRITHAYPQKTVLLDVWEVERWSGQVWGKESQDLKWSLPSELAHNPFPAANYPIIKALQLPSLYFVTPSPTSLQDLNFFYQLEKTLAERIISLVQFRAKLPSHSEFCHCAQKVLTLCTQYQARLLINADPIWVPAIGAHGVHLNSQRLFQYSQRPLDKSQLVAASCHTLTDILQANRLNLDFGVLSPVKFTHSHPEAKSLGWRQFFQLTEFAKCPIFALGGMTLSDLPRAWAHGGQGIAAIRGLIVADTAADEEGKSMQS